MAFLNQLPHWGFPVNPKIKIGVGIKFLMEYYEKAEIFREELDYDIDGVVIKVKDLVEKKSKLT